MRLVVYGAGAVGGVVGALVHHAGNEVVLIARGDHLAAIQRNGLRLETPTGASVQQIPAVASPAAVDWRSDDVVLLAVKSDATGDAVSSLAAFAPASIALVCLQNGVANEPTALRWFEHVYGVCVMAPTGHLEPGVVEAKCSPTPAILDIGRYPDGVDATATAIAAAFVDAGIVSQPRPDIMRWKYRKLMMNLANAVQAVCSRTDGFDELAEAILVEGEAALAAAGIEPVSEAEDTERRGDILQSREISGRPRSGGSSWQSLERRTGVIESDYFNGEIVWLGRRYDVATPANELIRLEATRLAAERGGPGSLDPRDLLGKLGGTGRPKPY
ncbi:MAG: ketopantoate reductase family protein [Actinomycetota bacterium]|nr:ketopantoate reductase family protein [Actinomycetota bacterium]